MACIIDALLLVTSLKKVPCPGSIVMNRTYCWINDQNMTRTFFMHMRTWTGLCASRHISRLRDRAYALQVAQLPTSLNFNLQSLGLPQRWNSWPLMIPARWFYSFETYYGTWIPQEVTTILYEDNDACTAMGNAQKPTPPAHVISILSISLSVNELKGTLWCWNALTPG